MKSRFTNYGIPLSALVVVFCLSLTAHATIPPTHPAYKQTVAPTPDVHRLPDPRLGLPRRDFDNYIGKLELLAEFLTTFQVSDEESPDFGGMREGETGQLWNIIETDNTQEAIRVWCEYGKLFDDPDRFRANIEAAWQYCDSFPAWLESPPEEMYALHNSGWGLVAETGYRELYGDGRRGYALNCAGHLVENMPRIPVDLQDQLMPLAVGWSVGTLYQYGILENNDEFKAAGIQFGQDIKAWLTAQPARLNQNEMWALCGGTAMWGVLNSLGYSDSTRTANWAIEILDNMDIFAGRGQWNNSWNIWYAHAWFASWERTGDEDYLNRAITIVDSLLAQDLDHDGGIPATGGDAQNLDQSWVTAYLGWMGLSNLYPHLPQAGVSLTRLLDPSLARPYPTGFALDFVFEAMNVSLAESLAVDFHLTGALNYDSTLTILGWRPTIIRLDDIWLPDESGRFDFTAIAEHADDPQRWDDTLRFAIDILPTAAVRFAATVADTAPAACRFDLYPLDFESNAAEASYSADSRTGEVLGELMSGRYRLAAIPEFPYAPVIESEWSVEPERENVFEVTFHQPAVLLVNAHSDSNYSEYFESSLLQTGYTYRRWDLAFDGALSERTSTFPTVIYYSGNAEADAMPVAAQNELEGYLEAGGKVLINGQNIPDALAGQAFLRDVLHTRHLRDDMENRVLVQGSPGDPILGGMELLLIGNRGAGNQTSPAGIEALDPAVPCAFYDGVEDTAAGVRWELENGAKGIFLTFGLEAVSGQGETTSRAQVIRSALRWLDTPLQVDDHDSSPMIPILSELRTYPNPANGAVFIRLPRDWQGTRVAIYDVSGRLIRLISGANSGAVLWDARNHYGIPVASGVYLLSGEMQGRSAVGRVTIQR